MQIWLMEHLRLIDPPENMESYNKRGFIARKKSFTKKYFEDWTSFFGDDELASDG